MARRLIKWAAGLSAAVFPPLALLIAVRAYRAEKAIFFPRRAPLQVSAEKAGLPGLIAVETSSPKIRGWYVPARNRAAVVLTHGAGGDRSQVLPEARALAAAGFGAFLFDWLGHGESEGEVHWDERERMALSGALDWLSERPEIDPERLGAFGFSMGGYIVAQVAAHEPRLKVVALAGTPTDVSAQSAWQFGKYSFLTRLPARWALERGGLPLGEPQPKDTVPEIAPRPLLVVAGTGDNTVPIFMGRALHQAARDPKELFVVEGADHGQYDAVAGEAYRAKLVKFFNRLLESR
jgi:uncharacterized protein